MNLFIADSTKKILGLIIVILIFFIFYSLLRIINGFRMNLYLIDRDAGIKDQMVIPITSLNRTRSIIRIILTKAWQEDIEIILTDYQDNSYTCTFRYHLWHWFCLVPQNNQQSIAINGKKINVEKNNPLKQGMSLAVGDRSFEIRVTSKDLTLPEHLYSA